MVVEPQEVAKRIPHKPAEQGRDPGAARRGLPGRGRRVQAGKGASCFRTYEAAIAARRARNHVG